MKKYKHKEITEMDVNICPKCGAYYEHDDYYDYEFCPEDKCGKKIYTRNVKKTKMRITKEW